MYTFLLFTHLNTHCWPLSIDFLFFSEFWSWISDRIDQLAINHNGLLFVISWVSQIFFFSLIFQWRFFLLLFFYLLNFFLQKLINNNKKGVKSQIAKSFIWLVFLCSVSILKWFDYLASNNQREYITWTKKNERKNSFFFKKNEENNVNWVDHSQTHTIRFDLDEKGG